MSIPGLTSCCFLHPQKKPLGKGQRARYKLDLAESAISRSSPRSTYWMLSFPLEVKLLTYHLPPALFAMKQVFSQCEIWGIGPVWCSCQWTNKKFSVKFNKVSNQNFLFSSNINKWTKKGDISKCSDFIFSDIQICIQIKALTLEPCMYTLFQFWFSRVQNGSLAFGKMDLEKKGGM